MSMGWAGAGFRQQRMPLFRSQLTGVVHGLQRDLELEHDAVGGLQRLRRAFTSAGFNSSFAPLTTMIRFCPGRIDEDRRHTAGHTAYLAHMRGIDTQLFKVLDG